MKTYFFYLLGLFSLKPKTRQVVVHLRPGFDRRDELSTRILDYLKDKDPTRVVFLCDWLEFGFRTGYSKQYGFPKENFHFSSDGHLDNVNLPTEFYQDDPIVEVMGYLYSPSGVRRCVNNALFDLRLRGKEVKMLEDLVKVEGP